MRVMLRLVLPLIGASLCAPFAQAAPADVVVAAPAPPGERLSQVYQLSVNGQSVPVIVYEAGRAPAWGASRTPRRIAIAHFAFAGQANIVIKLSQSVPVGVRISPLALGIKPAVTGNQLAFALDRPAKIAVHYGGKFGLDRADGLQERLFLFADTLEADVPRAGDPGVTDVGALGIDNSGTRFVAAQLQSAIDAAGIAGGGTVLVPPGTYNLDRQLFMRDHVRLHVADGALLRATTVRLDNSAGLIEFRNVTGASLTGRGTLTPNGSAFRVDSPSHPDFNNAVIVEVDGSPGTIVRDVTLRDAANIHLFAGTSPGVTVTGVKLVTDADYPNTDGIDSNDGSCGLSVDDVFIHNSDDAFAEGWGVGCTGLSVSNAVVWDSWNGVAMGVITNAAPGTFSGFAFENVDVVHTNNAISMRSGQSATLANTWFKAIRIENVELASVTATVGNGLCARATAAITGAITGVTLLDVVSADQGTPYFGPCQRSALYGAKPDASGRHDVSGVHFQAVRLGAWPITSVAALHHADFAINPYVTGLTFSSVEPAQVAVRASSLYAAPGQPSAFIVSRARGSIAAPLTVAYRIAGSARAGADYVSLPGSVMIPAGATSTTVPLTPMPGQAGAVRSVAIVLQPRMLSSDYVLGPEAQAQIAIVGEQ